MEILDRDRVVDQKLLCICDGESRRGYRFRSARGTPYVDEMALTGPNRACNDHKPRGPVGPAVDQGNRLGIGRTGQKIGAVKRRPMWQ